MTKPDILALLGVTAVREVGVNTVIEFPSGGARPASALEIRAIALLLDKFAS